MTDKQRLRQYEGFALSSRNYLIHMLTNAVAMDGKKGAPMLLVWAAAKHWDTLQDLLRDSVATQRILEAGGTRYA